MKHSELILGAVLAAEGDLLQSTAAALIDASGLMQTDFDGRERTTWQLISAAANLRKPVTPGTVWSAGAATKHFAPDDREWLTRLRDRNELDRESFAQVVSDFRRLIRGAKLEKLLRAHADALASRRSTAEEIASKLEAEIRELVALSADDGTAEDDILEIAQEWDRTEAGEASPLLIPTGIKVLDFVMKGWRPNLNMMVGLPSVGKSAALGTGIDAQLDMGMTVGLFGLEDFGSRWLSRRLLARELGIQVSDVGHLDRRQNQRVNELFADVGQKQSVRLRKLITYRHDTITIDELCRRATHWVLNRGVQIIYVDHGGEVDHTDDRFEEHRLRVAESYRRLRNLAVRLQVPVVVLAHTTRDSDDEFDRPPRMKEIAESAYIERRARIIVGLWRRQGERDYLRATVLKNTEGESGVSMKLKRLVDCALIDREEGETVNLEQERRDERRRANELKAQEKREKEAADKKSKEEAKAAKEAEKRKKAPQLSLVAEAEESSGDDDA